MAIYFPGTIIPYDEKYRTESFSAIAPLIEATGGLTLAQLSKVTELEGSTIQNWIKRGWISSTVGKRYSKQQIVRILLFNMLRGELKLDDIASLMTYVNGNVEDVSDDIIDDVLLYDMLCRIVFSCEESKAFEPETVKKRIDAELKLMESEIHFLGEEKLKKALYVGVMCYRAKMLKSYMQPDLEHILQSTMEQSK